MLDGLKKLIGSLGRGAGKVASVPYKGLEAAAQATAGTHMVTPGAAPAGTPVQAQLKYPQLAQLAQLARPGQNPQLPQLPHFNIPLPPGLRAINSFGELQQPARPTYEDDYTAAMAAQPTGFTNQASLNGQLLQGPMAPRRSL